MLALELEPARAESAGMYVPESRNDLMFDIRRREEAEGERSMIGSGRRPAFLSLEARVVVGAGAVAGALGFFRSFMKTSEYFLTCEKS